MRLLFIFILFSIYGFSQTVNTVINGSLDVVDLKHIYVANIPDTTTVIPANDTVSIDSRMALIFENSVSDWTKTDSSFIYKGRKIRATFDGHADVSVEGSITGDISITFHIYINGIHYSVNGCDKAFNTTRTFGVLSRYTGFSIGAIIELNYNDEIQVFVSHDNGSSHIIGIKSLQLRIEEITYKL